MDASTWQWLLQGRQKPAVKYIIELNRTPYYYILPFLLLVTETGSGFRVRVIVNEKRWKKLVLMKEVSICEFQNRIQIWDGRQIVLVDI